MTLTNQLSMAQIVTKGGHQARFAIREDVNDGALVAGIIGGDEYDLARLSVEGWMIDIGAHIGIVCVAVALDNPSVKIVAVEAIPENADIVRHNVELNGLSGRIFVESAGASEPGAETVGITYDYRWAGLPDHDRPVIPQDYLEQCRFIGNVFRYPEGQMEATTEQVPALSLDQIIEKYEMPDVALVKIDCEGCEYQFLATKAVRHVARILGEFHKGAAPIKAMLKKTHDVTIRIDRGGVGIFDAVRR